MIHPEMNKRYLENPDHCPQCESENIKAYDFQTSSNKTAFREMRCRDCGEYWEENYQMTDITDQDSNSLATPEPNTFRYAIVKLEMNADDEHDADEIVSEADYSFVHHKIISSEIKDVLNEHPLGGTQAPF